MEAVRSGVILAGGMGRRIGLEKSLMDFSGKTLTQWVAENLQGTVNDIVVVARDKEQAARLKDLIPKARVTCDRVSGYGPLAGLAAGMRSSAGEYSLAVGCDLPFLSAKVVERLFELAKGYDAAVPLRPDGMVEVLHAVYHTERMKDSCQRALDRGDRKVLSPLRNLCVNYVPIEQLRSQDPNLLSFFNINTREDLIAAMHLTGKKVIDDTSAHCTLDRPL
jgi:molybdopterin-guanine dinucleotide biosynthesis protein A